MAIDLTTLIRTGAQPTGSEQTDADKAEIVRLAQQFEAMLMTQMLREMRKSMLSEEEEGQDGFGAQTLTDTGDIELGQALSQAGGLGLSDALLAAFERQINPKKAEATLLAHARSVDPLLLPDQMSKGLGAAISPSIQSPTMPFRAEDVAGPAPVTSEFGWRQDPLTGVSRFHQGVDIAVAYGRDVRAAADGVVAFAGVQDGYGNTVVVDHEGGRQTRYAHLSDEFVRAGDTVTEGQILGKSGNSGRTTGPHLHFEMLVNGQPVDPVSGRVE